MYVHGETWKFDASYYKTILLVMIQTKNFVYRKMCPR